MDTFPKVCGLTAKLLFAIAVAADCVFSHDAARTIKPDNTINFYNSNIR